MPRSARELSRSGIYHVMVRGINRQDIFLEPEDYLRYLGTLAVVKERSRCKIHGYCLLTNHVHLLLQEGDEGVGQVMKRVGASYVRWYNNKYQRVGHLFQDRFLSEAVEDDAYFLTVLRYIHRNPEKAGLVAVGSGYPWSSYQAYTEADEYVDKLVDTGLALGIVGGVAQFAEFSSRADDDQSPLEEQQESRDGELLELVRSFLGERRLPDLQTMKKSERDSIILAVKSSGRATNAQIARVTGLSMSAVQRATRRSEQLEPSPRNQNRPQEITWRSE